MALTLKAEQKSIYDIFSGKTQYYIPPYQRPYSWQIQHCRELFEDLKREFYNKEKEGYFLGNIVLAWNMEERNRFEVIDGQQRLTTLLLLLQVLLVFDSQNSDIKNAIWIEDVRDSKIKDTRLQFSDYLEEYNQYKEILEFDLNNENCDKEIDEKNLFIQNICYFYSEIKELNEYEKIDRFVDFLLYDIYLLPIETGDSTSIKARNKALRIFETINNRGLNLSNADIFKARLYEEAINMLEEDKFIELWNKFERNVNETKYSIDDVFYIYMYIIRGREGIKSKELNIRDFFMEEQCSPFGNIKYDEIIYNITRIVYSIKVFEDVKINPNKYGELTKWFQIIDEYEYRIFFKLPLSFLLSIIQLSVIDLVSIIKLENIEKTILYFKNLIKYLLLFPNSRYYNTTIINIVYNQELVVLKKINDVNTKSLSFYVNYKMQVILSSYLNKKQKAIYPYYLKKILRDKKNRNMVVLNFDARDDVSLEEKIKLLEESAIEDNFKLAKELRKIPKVKFVNEIAINAILLKQEIIIKKRIERFFKDEN